MANLKSTNINGNLTVTGDLILGGGAIKDFPIEMGEDEEKGTRWIKYNSGILEQYLKITVNNIALDNNYGNKNILYFGRYSWNFPIKFVKIFTVICGQFKYDTGGSWGSVYYTDTNTAQFIGFDLFPRTKGSPVYITGYIIGTWK